MTKHIVLHRPDKNTLEHFENTLPEQWEFNQWYRWNKESALYINSKGYYHLIRVEHIDTNTGKFIGIVDYLLQGDTATQSSSQIMQGKTRKEQYNNAINLLDERSFTQWKMLHRLYG